jgi:hypothetical protein
MPPRRPGAAYARTETDRGLLPRRSTPRGDTQRLPDKSAFIRDAILQRYHTVCPFCQGRGVLPQIVAEWLSSQVPVLNRWNAPAATMNTRPRS